MRGDRKEARKHFREALERNRADDVLLESYADFLKDEDVDEAEKLYRQALALDPQSIPKKIGFANFLWEVRKNEKEAESLLRNAVESSPWSAEANGALAVFLWQTHKDVAGAEAYFRRAIEINPSDPNTLGNYAGYLLAQGRTEESAEKIAGAKKLMHPGESQLRAELPLYSASIARLQKQNDIPFLYEIKLLFSDNYSRGSWSFSDVLARVRKDMSANRQLCVF